MPPPATTADFVELIRRSGVLDEPRLGAYLTAAGTAVPREPNKLASQMVREGLLTYFQAEQFLQGKWKRFTIGKYKVLERLGSGGMGQVFLCEHKLMRRRVAVKVLPSAKAEDQAALERFYREARAVAALDHPNLVRAYDIDQDESLHFLVMEYVDGSSLQDLVKKSGPLTPERAAHYMHQAAIGLDYAYQVASIIHRDIKPANVLVDRGGIIKILDMGLARFFNDEQDILTKKYDESVLGTADYLAPEQAMDSHSVDIRADIYSLGATFHYVLTGFPPFPEGTVTQKLMWHQTKPPKPVAAYRNDVPPAMLRLVDEMMSKDPAGRPQTPAQLAEFLAPFTQTPIAPPTEAELPQLSRAAMAAASGAAGGTTGAATGRFNAAKNAGVSGRMPTSPAASAAGMSAALSRGGAVADTRGGPRTATAVAAPAGVRAPSTPPNSSVFVPPAAPARPPGFTPQPAGTLGGGEYNPYQAMMGSAPAPGYAAPGYAAEPAAPPPPARGGRGWLAAVVAVGLIAAGGTAAFFFFNKPGDRKGGAGPTPVEGDAVRKHTVSQNPAGGTFRSVADALKKAARHDRIVLMDPVHRESLVYTAQNDRDVTIEGGLDKPVQWLAGDSGSADPLVSVTNFEGLTLRNIEFDGTGQADTLVVVSGNCPGTKLDRVTLRGFRTHGVKLVDCVAEAGDRAVQLVGCRAVATGEPDAAVAVVTLARPARGIAVRDCRFEGPFKAAVAVQATTHDLVIERNRFLRPGVAVRLGKPGKDQSFQVSVIGNTVVEAKVAGIELEAPLAADGRSKVAVEQNLFSKVPVAVKLDAVAGPYLVASRNARDEATKDGALPQPAAQAKFSFLATEPAAGDAKFLRYGKDGPLAALGRPGVSE